jgi:hypothetical protein
VDPKSKVPEISGNVKESQRFGPEVEGREVINPRVDKDETRFHMTTETLSKKWMKSRRTEVLIVRVGDDDDRNGGGPKSEKGCQYRHPSIKVSTLFSSVETKDPKGRSHTPEIARPL